MPLTFSVELGEGYLCCTFTGRITDEELVSAWREFYEGDAWVPGLNELADVRDADVSGITPDGLRRLAEMSRKVMQKHHVESMKVAICAPRPLSFGLARMYEVYTAESPEMIRVFENLEDAVAWLKEPLAERGG